MSFISILLAVFILGLLVVVHEFGHFIVARKNGVHVVEFSIGFGPRILSKVSKKSGTRFSWKAIPFGGSCQMLGMFEDEDDGTDDERSYDRKSVWARMSITLAGPFFNFLLAFVLAVIMVGTTGYDPATVTYVEPGSPIYEAGVREGDLITSYNGTHIDFGREIYLENYLHPASEGKAVDITYKRDGEKHKVSVMPEKYDYYVVGLSYYANDAPAEIAEVTEDSPMAKAGIDKGDVITSLNGIAIETGADLGAYFEEHELTAEPLEVTYLHHGVEKRSTVTPEEASSYRLGFSYNRDNVKTGVGGTLKYSFAEIKYQVLSVFKSIGFLFSDRGSLDMVSGPVGIVEIIGTTYDASAPSGFLVTLINMFGIVILLSTNLGVINLLPFPALDGGRFILLIIEAIRRKPLQKKYEGIITMIGAVLIMLLAVVVLVNDVLKFF